METPIGPMGLRHSLRAPLAAGLRRTIGQIGVSIRGQASIGLTSQHSSAVAEQESDQSEFFFLPGPPLHKAEMRPGAGDCLMSRAENHPMPKFCKHCGDPMGKGEIFCDFCGRILYSPS